MSDREKVLAGLICCNSPNDHENCPYNKESHYNICTHKLLKEAASLLSQCCDNCRFREAEQNEVDSWEVCARLEFRPVRPDFYCGYWEAAQ